MNIPRILLVFEAKPLNPDILKAWREWAIGKGAMDIKAEIFTSGDVKTFLENSLKPWLSLSQKSREEPGVKKGEWISFPGKKAQKGDPSLLSLMVGSTGELLSYLDWVRKDFSKACQFKDAGREKYLKSIAQALKDPKQKNSVSSPLGVENLLDHLPRVLLLGETGVGKTLFARYLSGVEKMVRISIPEYLAKEDMFEYDLFGYTAHAYSGANPDGSPGILLNNLGGVVFLDELGEASPKIQQKLLAFLDDYRVRPRGWNGEPFYCPVLIVGATNQPMDKDKEKYRNDLLQRFTHVKTIPPLRDRKANFHMLLDCLLQNGGVNTDGAIEEVGDKAFKFLLEDQYKEGNFRELENRMRHACQRARLDGRNYLVVEDFKHP
ncbi:MAG: sigma 54-interacting transcriptional regulator [Nitrospinae bacterium]|nr:sigma 54-interacting transcriptional regulator [Nitrospinota bacterium]